MEDLVVNNEGLIYDVLKKMNIFYRCDELYDIGTIALVKAAKTYDPSKGYTFSTYAFTIIRNAFLLYLRNETSEKRKANYKTISLNAIVNTSRDGEVTLQDTIASDYDLESEILKKEAIEKLHLALSKLNEDQYELITTLFGIGKIGMTQKEMAKMKNTSQSSINRKKKRIVEKLRKLMEEEECLKGKKL